MTTAATASYEAKLIEARLSAAAGTLAILRSCYPDAADFIALIRSDLDAIRMILSWRADDLMAAANVVTLTLPPDAAA